jgi:hypothetical protein
MQPIEHGPSALQLEKLHARKLRPPLLDCKEPLTTSLNEFLEAGFGACKEVLNFSFQIL